MSELSPACYRHPQRVAAVSCQRCERPICPDCMTEASVGFHCPECVATGRRSVARVASVVPVVSYGIISLCVGAWLLTILTGGAGSPIHLQGAMLGATTSAPDGTQLTGVADGAWWRLLTSAFLHHPAVGYGIVHLGLNMYALYLFGPYAEQTVGRWRFALGYLTMALGASVAVYWLSDPHAPTIGASGAVFGVFGFTLMLLVSEGREVRGLLVMLALNAVFSLQGGISWQAHAGGLLTGLALGAVFAWSPRQLRNTIFVGTTALLWLGFAGAVVARSAAFAL